MKIYYDSHCKVCNKIKDLLLKISNKSDGVDFVFLEIRESDYAKLYKETIVVEFEMAKCSEILTHGKALQIIFKNTRLPYRFVSYLPIFILDAVYIFMRKIRKYL